MTKPLHVINWQGKEYRIPFDLNLTKSNADKLIDVTNPYSGAVASLPWFAVDVYNIVKLAEVEEDYNLMQKGLTWFQKYFTKEYYTLLD